MPQIKNIKISTFSTRLKYYATVAGSEHTTACSPFVVTLHLVGFTSRDNLESHNMQIYIVFNMRDGWVYLFCYRLRLLSFLVLFPDLWVEFLECDRETTGHIVRTHTHSWEWAQHSCSRSSTPGLIGQRGRAHNTQRTFAFRVCACRFPSPIT